ncbi:MAG TPA: PQQ-binding-like beta-propeller repeat protein [Terriglobia bacterium]|nr:PQQ-binding-like beta-propeller repeat protein [Terriglobia bacterium]
MKGALLLKSQPWRIAAPVLVVLALSLSWLWGQSSAVEPSQLTEGRKIFAVQCAACHGADARGGEYGPPLAGTRRLRKRSLSWLRHVIRNGISTGGMPAFHLTAGELDALAALVQSLNLTAAEHAVSGDGAVGKQYFFGQGQCASCHMVDGRGSAVGPDLSNVAREMTVEEIRTSLLRPSEDLTAAYQTVTVRLRDGKTLRGFVRSRSNFEIVVQDLKGQFHLLRENEVSAVSEDKRSLMPPVKTNPEDLQNLIAYLSGLAGIKPGAAQAAGPSGPGGISGILHPRPGDWPTYNGRLNGNRYSALKQINTTNVNRLRLKWIFTVPLWKQFLPDTSYFIENMKYFGLEVTPLVAGGIMYATGPHQAFALDARTGREIWAYSRPRTPGLIGDAALGTNRGMAILGDKVFMVTENAHLIALNRTTGKLVWEAVMPDEPMHYGSTVAPLVVKGMVIAGVSGGDWGMRGFLAAYKASNGKRLWRHWTIPDKGGPGANTWGGNPPKTGGGATWLTGSYDPETDTLYWPTGNPYPDSDDRARPGDNLYTDCILALDPDNGNLKWFYQVTPHDVHDWDANAPLVLVDTKYQGRERKLLLHADKNGFFYVLDRTNGHVLLARPFVRVTWASGIGPDGRPQFLPGDGELCPGEYGANWNATAFSPVTCLYYLMALEKCVVRLSAGSWKQKHPKAEAAMKYLEALDIDTGKIVWKVPQFGPVEGKRDAGVLATAGGLLFYGDPGGDMVAADARNGKALWHFPANGENKASPMTYRVNGKQYVAIAVGPNILCFGLP